ncbi:MAG TPA: DUF4249 domain-containing protein [Chitinophagaceae bacterium]
MKRISYLFIFLLLAVLACRERYDINLKSTDKVALVVEGYLNGGNGPTSITLSRSYALNSVGSPLPVTKAQVTVEGDNGSSFSLTEVGSTGRYRHSQLTLLPTQQYRLRIKTQDNTEYLSEYVPVLSSPAIDSINWKWENEGIMFYANTHDATAKSKYYRWEYEDTWEIISNYSSFVKVVDTLILPRNFPAEDVSHCWKYGTSSSIMLGTTAQLQSDVVFEAPLYFLPKNIEKLGVRYSTLVKQQVLTRQAYEYFLLMKKNTEQLGSIFDPLPSELRGNIRCLSNPAQQVIGYITAGITEEKRIFVSSNDLPGSNYIFPNCSWRLVPNKKDSLRKWMPALMPYAEDLDLFGNVVGYFMAPLVCSDCTARGGSNVKPSYW